MYKKQSKFIHVMKELQFRAWDKSQKYMAYQGDPDLETLSSFMFHFGGDIVMQAIGIQDKDAYDVYEGDILKDTEFDEEGNDISSYHPVIYDPKTCQFCIDNSLKKDGSHLVNIVEYFEIDNIEVVGNIYQNPELLPSGSIYVCT